MSRYGIRTARYGLVSSLVALAMPVTGIDPVSASPGEPDDVGTFDAGDGSISVTVIEDVNGNGNWDVGPEVGIEGVTVTAEDPAGGSVETTTGSDGSATLDPTSLVGGAYRVRVVPPGGSLEAAPAGGDLRPLVDYVDVSEGADANLVMGLWDPSTMVDGDPWLVSPMYHQVNQDGQLQSLVASQYSDSGTFTPTTIAVAGDTGSLWGVADYGADYLFSGAYLRRHQSLGPAGPGGIYLTDFAAALEGTPNAEPFVTIPNAGADPRPADPDWLFDEEAVAAVGKVGLGDVEVSPDLSTLYATNFNDGQVYEVPLQAGDGGAPEAAGDPTPLAGTPTAAGCAADWSRPFGLGFLDGTLYLGVTCSGPTAADLNLDVFAYDTTAGSWQEAPAMTVPLDPDQFDDVGRGCVDNYHNSSSNTSGPAAQCDPRLPRGEGGGNNSGMWNAWSDDQDNHVGTVIPNPSRTAEWYPQPMLSDIEFDGDGNMILGVRDRLGDQTGYNIENRGTSMLYTGETAGQNLRACGNPTDGWQVEQQGSCGGVPGSWTNPGVFSGGSYQFYDQTFSGFGYNPLHPHTAVGAVAQVPGFDTIATTQYDPRTNTTNGDHALGLTIHNHSDGSMDHVQQWFRNPGSSPNSTLGKSGGLGDLEAMLAAAPVQIGNRTWFDANADGIQDPDEPAIPGVTVSLTECGDATGASVQTDADGLYYFGEADALTAGAACTVAFDFSTADTSGLPDQPDPSELRLTQQGAGDDPQLDSDAVPADGTATVTTGSPQSVNHSIDAGVSTEPQQVDCVVGDFVWLDANEDGIQDDGDEPLAGATVTLFLTADDSEVASTTTDAAGQYVFEAVACDEYYATFEPPADQQLVPTQPQAGDDPAVDSNPDDTGRTPNFTVTEENPEDLTIDAGFVPDDVVPPAAPALDKKVNGQDTVAEPLAVQPGEEIDYTIAVAAGEADQTAVTVEDVLPDGITYVADDADGAYDPASGVWTVGDLAADEAVTLTITATVGEDAVDGATITNRSDLLVDGTPVPDDPEGDPPSKNESPTDGVDEVDIVPTVEEPPGELPGLDKKVNGDDTMTDPLPVQPGDEIDYTITVEQPPADGGGGGVGVFAAGSVSGTVFRDFNHDGFMNTSASASLPAVDTGVEGVEVTAVDAAGTEAGSAVTDENGEYVLDFDTSGDASDVRVEFTVPDGFSPGPVGSGGDGVQSGTTRQFVSDGGVANLGLVKPSDHAQSDPLLVTPSYRQYPLYFNSGTDDLERPALQVSSYSDSGELAPTTLARVNEVGSVWGVATYGADYVFSSAYLKRHAVMGPEGLGAVYLTDVQQALGGESNGTPFVTIPNAGDDPRGDALPKDEDDVVIEHIGRVGLGGMELADDRSALYATNLNDGQVYEVPLEAHVPGEAPVAAGEPAALSGTPTASDCDAEWSRSFGLGFGDGLLYLGVTCSGPTADDLHADVFTYDTASGSWSDAPAFTMPLDPAAVDAGTGRGCVNRFGQRASSCEPFSPREQGGHPGSSSWNAWADDPTLFVGAGDGGGTNSAWYPQPMLSDIELDDGNLILGVRDRLGDQTGWARYANPVNPSLHLQGETAGQTMRACGSLEAGWELESLGSCGGSDGAVTNPFYGEAHAFYDQRYYQTQNTSGAIHPLTSFGGGVQIPGYESMIATAYDTMDDTTFTVQHNRAGGLRGSSNTTGETTMRQQWYRNVSAGPTNQQGAWFFGKSNGLGDLDALLEEPPLEIGNRVWLDEQQTGVQDPGEPGIEGVTVCLVGPEGTELAQVVTGAAGEYYFNDSNVDGGLQLNTDYTVALCDPADYEDGGSLADLFPAAPGSGSDPATDSDGVENPDGLIEAPVTTGDLADNDHTIDFGFSAEEVLPPEDGIVCVNDVLPEGVTFVSADASVGEYDPASGSWEIGTMAAGDTATLAITATVDEDVAPGEPITNTAELCVDGEPVPDEPNPDQDDPEANTDPDDGVDNVDIVPDEEPEPTCVLGDFVWLDANADGLQDADEPGVPGVTVNLLDASGEPATDENGEPVTATTDAFGLYLFEDIACDEYLVEFVPPEGMEFTEQQAGDNPVVDSNPNPADGITPPVVLDPEGNPEDLTVDAGLIGGEPPALDKQVNGDDTIEGPVTVAPGEEIAYTITVANPSEVDVEALTVEDQLPVGVTYVSDDGDGAFDPDAGIWDIGTLTAGQSVTLTITAAVNENVAAGELITNEAELLVDGIPVPDVPDPDQDDPSKNDDPDDGLDNVDVVPEPEPVCALGDYVWLDANADGIQDGDEAGVAGVTVNLLDVNGEPVLDENGDSVSVTTDENGMYLFEGIACDEYMVEFVPPEGMEFTDPEQGDDPGMDSNPNPEDGITPPATLHPEENPEDLTVDAGLIGEEPPTPPGLDKAVNGDDTIEGPVTVVPGEEIDYTITVANPTEVDVEAVTVSDQLPAAVTYVSDDSEAAYDPDAGVWDVGTLPAGGSMTLTITATVNDDVAAGEPITNQADLLIDGEPVPDVPNPDQDDPSKNTDPDDGSDNVDIVPEPVCALGDYVWLDANADGIQDGDEPGVPGVTVNLLDANGEPVVDENADPVTATTDELGGYLFQDTACGEYMVEFVPPEGMEFTEEQAGDDPAVDSNPNPDNGVTPPVVLDPEGNPEDLTVDAGLVGEEPPTPPGLDKQVNGDDTIEGPVTVAPGEEIAYTITVANPTEADVVAVTVADRLPAGVTYVSDDSGGTYDPESGVWDVGTLPAGGSVTLTITATVNDDVAPGELITNEAELSVDGTPVPDVPDPDQDDPSKNPDPDDGSDNVDIVPEPEPEPLCTLGDYVWLDANADGIQDGDEVGVPGVVVNLLDANGDPVVGENGEPVTTTTDELGGYGFEDIACDEYMVEFVPPEAMEFTEQQAGDDPVVDSNPNPDDGITPPVVLDPDENPEDLTVDAGLIGEEPPTPPGLDKTVNGDDTIEGPVTVASGEEIDYTITVANPTDADVEAVTVSDQLPAGVTYVSDDSDGAYDPDAGVWNVGVLPAGQSMTLTITATIDEDVAPGELITNEAELSVDGTPVPDVPNPDQDDPSKNDEPEDGSDNVDIVPEPDPEELCTLGDYVWLDLNEDGAQGADEPGVPGVTVNLLDADGEPVTDENGDPVTTTTDEFGFYLFEDITCDEYRVEFVPPEGLEITEPEQGDDPAVDSNPNPEDGITPPVTLDPDESPEDLTIDAGLVPEEMPELPGLDKQVNGDDTIGGPLTVTPGEEIGYTITVTNPADVDAANVTVEDQLPAGVTFVSDDGDGAYAADTGVWDVGTLPAGETATLTITATVNEDVAPGEVITNEAELFVDGTPMPDRPDDSQDDPSKNDEPDDGLDSVDVVPEPEELCTLGDYVWLDANTDGVQDPDEDAVPGVVVNLLDANGEPVVDENGDPVSVTTDENGMYLFEGIACDEYLVEFVPPEGMEFTDPEQGDDPAQDSNPNPEDGITPPVALDPDENPEDLTVDAGLVGEEPPTPPGLDKQVNGDDTIEAPVTVAPGEEITYTIAVANPTDVDVEAVTAEDQLPAGVTYVSDDSDGAYDPAAGVWDVGTLPAGGSVTLTITATVNEDVAAGELITNEAELLVDGTPVPDVPDPDQDDPSKNTDPDDGSDNVDIVPEPVCSLGDYVWLDTNEDGLQDADESGIEGVSVVLLTADGEQVTSTTTDADGWYVFDEISCGDYYVWFDDLPDDTGFTEAFAGDPAADSNVDPGTGTTPVFTVGEDAGNTRPATPDDGVTAELIDPTIDAGVMPGEEPEPPGLNKMVNGADTIDGPVTVAAGEEITYTITVTNPSDADVEAVTVTDQLPAGVTYVSDDSDGAYDPESGVWDVGTLPAGETVALTITVTINEDAAAGEPITNEAQLEVDGTPVPDQPNDGQDDPTKNTDPDDGSDNVDVVPEPEPEPVCTLGDFVWLDTNGDGIQDAGESGVPGVVVNLLDATGEPVVDENGDPITTTTGELGGYLFEDIACDEYLVEFVAPEAMEFTETDQGDDPSVDSNPNPDDGVTPPVTLDPDENPEDLTVDAGLVPDEEPPTPPGLDKQVNGDDTIEGPVKVVPGEEIDYTITVTNPSESDVEAVTVDDQLPAGVTYVSDDSDGAYDPESGVWDVGTLPAGDSVTLTITVTVNEDAAAGEPITNEAQLEVDGTPVPDQPNPDQDDPTKNTDPDDGFDGVDVVPEPEPEELCSLGDVVWLDADRDGIQDEGEEPVPDTTVNLLDENGDPVTDDNGDPVTVTTDENGMYMFEDVACDEYRVEFVPPEDMEFTEPEQGDDPSVDSNPDPEDGITPPVTLDPEENPEDLTVDAGLVPEPEPDPDPVCAIGDYVWLDDDEDGLQDSDESGVPGVRVVLATADGDEVSSTTTDTAGRYMFDDVECGEYYVWFDELSDDASFTSPLEGDDPETDSDADPDTATTATFTVGDDSPNTRAVEPSDDVNADLIDDTIDAGIVGIDEPPEPEPVCSLGQMVWLDENTDGVRQDGESGLGDVVITLYRASDDEVIGERTTGENGRYRFRNLVCDEYYLTFELPDGYEFTDPGRSDDPERGSTADETGRTPNFTLDADEQPRIIMNAGVVRGEQGERRCAVGDYVWLDANGDGLQDDNEEPMAGVQIRLYTPDQELVATISSDDEGGYLFEDVDCDDYYLVFATPSGYQPTTRHAGDDQGADSDINREGSTSVFSLSVDASPDLTLDAGYVEVTSRPPSQQPPTQQPPSQQPPSSQPPKVGPIPVTGTSIAVTLVVALMALAAGGGLWFLGRRRGNQPRMTGCGSDR